MHILTRPAEMEGEVRLEVQALYLDSALAVGDFCGAFDILLKTGEGHPSNSTSGIKMSDGDNLRAHNPTCS